MPETTILYAPNVHVGGGLVLLRAVLRDWPSDRPLLAILDARARAAVTPPAQAGVTWVRATVASRWNAERLLARLAGPQGTVLCFHGLPPLFSCQGRVVVFLQNRVLLDLLRLRDMRLRIALRVAAERAICRLFKHRVDHYIVQTPSMARALIAWHKGFVAVSTVPFADAVHVARASQRQWDFVYVSDGQVHKNHARLLQAWVLLAKQGIRPSLALTLHEDDRSLLHLVHDGIARHGLQVHNIGRVSHSEVLDLYASAGALIFPSLGESFGLPLIEARQATLPILAPELDYVRDVCVPAQTFDPQSAVSIARAVKRFLGQEVAPSLPGTATAFWAAVHDADRRNIEGVTDSCVE